jgi:two-component system KDP operon response regulator KdpE
MRILVVDDERQITRALRASLQGHGFEVSTAVDGLEALEMFDQVKPDLLITDLSMPNMDGVELTKAVRKFADLPIIVLSVRDQDAHKVLALDSGADDYVTKPFSVTELLARVRAQLRRRGDGAPAPATRLEEGDFIIDTEAHRVLVRGQELHLSPKEFDLLLLLLRNAGRVLTHKTLLRGVWGPGGEDQPDYLRVLVAQLRKRIDLYGGESYIESEPWVGYRLRSISPFLPTSNKPSTDFEPGTSLK